MSNIAIFKKVVLKTLKKGLTIGLYSYHLLIESYGGSFRTCFNNIYIFCFPKQIKIYNFVSATEKIFFFVFPSKSKYCFVFPSK